MCAFIQLYSVFSCISNHFPNNCRNKYPFRPKTLRTCKHLCSGFLVFSYISLTIGRTSACITNCPSDILSFRINETFKGLNHWWFVALMKAPNLPENVPGMQTSTEWQMFKSWRQNHICGRTCKGNYKWILNFEFVRYLLTL